jgi:hypothetical protein
LILQEFKFLIDFTGRHAPEAQNHHDAMVLTQKFAKGLDYHSRAIFEQVWPKCRPIGHSKDKNCAKTGVRAPF